MDDTGQFDNTEDIFERATQRLPLKNKVDCKRGTKGWVFYQKVYKKLPRWWEEFNSLTLSGKRKYKSIRKLAEDKLTSEIDRDMLIYMLGPKPEGDDVVQDWTWVGDWAAIRRTGFNNFMDPMVMRSLAQGYQKRLNAVELAKCAGPLIMKELNQWAELTEQIKDAFNGQPFDDEQAPHLKSNKNRAKFYIAILSQVTRMKANLWHEWYRSLGLNPQEPETWALAQAPGLALPAAPPTLDAQVISTNQPGQLPDGTTLDDLLMAKALRAKSKRFKMDMPGELNDVVQDTTEEDIKAAKKVKVH